LFFSCVFLSLSGSDTRSAERWLNDPLRRAPLYPPVYPGYAIAKREQVETRDAGQVKFDIKTGRWSVAERRAGTV
jgi:hypothetical protein